MLDPTKKNETLHVGIVTVSDRAHRGEYEDLSGPAIRDWLTRALTTAFTHEAVIVPDERDQISAELVRLADDEGCHLILTTGGTGPAPRDVTPEATLDIADKELPGFGEKMRAISLKYVPTAILSRQVGVIRGGALIVNLPGSPRSIAEILDDLFEAIPRKDAPSWTLKVQVMPFEEAATGAVGLETLLPGALRLFHSGLLDLPTLFARLSLAPAARFGLPGGRLAPGAPADLVLFDPAAPFRLDRDRLRSKSKNTPFDRQRLEGRVLGTWVAGARVYGG